jgi:hypothetical protein
MPLNPAGLQSDLEALFAEPPETREACAQAWADAIEGYASGLVPASTAVASAAATLASSLESAFAAPAAAAPFDAAFTTFAAAVAVGQAPTFTGVPPAAPLGIAALLGSPQATHAAAAAAFASLIDTWAKTGTAVLVAPPNTVVPWS